MSVTKALRGALCVAVLALVPACSAVSGYQVASPPPHTPVPRDSVAPPRVGTASPWINGVVLSSMGDLHSWETATGEHPAVIAMFSQFGAPLPLWAIKLALEANAVPLVQLDPTGVSLAAIAHGVYDRRLRAYGAAIRSLNDPVFLSFGHEMNGVWYSWGCGRASPRLFRAAWRHIHALITAPRVMWMWTINDMWYRDPCPLRPWYPGSAYVNWVGIDGYLRSTAGSFTSAFGLTLPSLRRVAPGKPALLAESGVPLGPGWAQKIRNLYAGAHRAGLRGILYFDGATPIGNYRPQDRPAALAVFRNVLRKWS
jgi:hypothetical protein